MPEANNPAKQDRQALRRAVEGIRSVYTVYPKLKKLRQDIIDLKNRDNSKSQGNVHLIVGEPGAGKTKLIEDLERAFPREESAIRHDNGDFSDRAELVWAEIPDTSSRGVAKSIYKAMALQEATDVLGKRATRMDIEAACISVAKEIGLKLLILEEAHQSIDDETEKVAKEVAVTLKTMVNKKLFSIALFGTEAALRLVLAKNELSRRTYVHRIEPFSDQGQDMDVWLEILSDYDDRLEKIFGRRSGLDEPGLAEALRVAGFGYVGNMAAVVEEAALLAVDEVLLGKTKEPGVTWNNLQEAFAKWGRGMGHPNPFTPECRPASAAKPEQPQAAVSSAEHRKSPGPGASGNPKSGVRGVTRSTARDASFRK